jgi:putative membrane protein
MHRLAIFALIGGLALATILVLSYGAGAILHAIASLGANGFAIIVVWHLGLIGLMGVAWWLLGRHRASLPCYAWGRLIRDSAAEALPLSQLGGYVLGARAVTLAGLPGAFAAGSTVVDVTIELVAQLAYTLIGLALLNRLLPANEIVRPLLTGLAVMALLVGVFVAVQARGAGWVEHAGRRLAGVLLGGEAASSGAVQAEISRLHARKLTLLSAALVHLASWLLSGVETWLTLRLMGIPVPAPAAVAIDSLLYGLRSLAFLVPNAVGVQEAGLVLLGGLFGVGADQALALSLIKRGRDLVIGVPALLIWQSLEGRRAWRGRIL